MARSTKPKRLCSVCGRYLTYSDLSQGYSTCELCGKIEAGKRGICEDRDPGGHDTVSHMRLLENGDPTLLASDLASMGITENGDDPTDDEL